MRLKVTISRVTSLEGDTHTEVTGCSPDINSELAACLASGRQLSPGRKAKLLEMIRTLAHFARAVKGG